MEVGEFLDFCGRIKGVPGAQRKARVDEAIAKTRIGDVRRTLIGRLSKGYRQRVGLAQAILHNPEVLILDEPTAGLDPKQIIETRDLIKSLGGEHTIVLSTHILPEVSMTCSRVVIINKGKVVAEDSTEALGHRLKGAATIRVEVKGEVGPAFDALRQVPGVATLRPRNAPAGVAAIEIEPESGKDIRAELARSVVARGYDLLGLSQMGVSLEDVFLHLTTSEPAEETPATASEVTT
jgi:ABC-2 type transport system ATP-binding protein